MSRENQLRELLSNFRPVDFDCATTFQPYFQAYKRTTRYFQSLLWLQKIAGTHFYAIIDGCLVVLKRKCIMNNYMLTAVLPPMRLVGDASVEFEIVKNLVECGVAFKLSSEDLAAYGISVSSVQEDDEGPEYVYSNQQWVDISGGNNKNARATMNKFDALYDSDEIHAVRMNNRADMSKQQELAKSWQESKGFTGQDRILKALHVRKPLENISILSITNKAGRCIGFSVTEKVSPGRVVIVSRLRDYADNTIQDMALLLHMLDCRYWDSCDVRGFELNMGAAGKDAGQRAAKEKLRPKRLLEIYTLKPPAKLTREEWAAALPNTSVKKGGFAL